MRNEAGAVTGAVVQAGSVGQVNLVASRPPVRPAQLPPDVSHFTGRTREMAELNTLLTTRTEAVVISAIAGTGGVGKTSLAVHWAHRVRDRFPDGQLYVNLRGFDPDPPVPPAQALDGFLRALGMSGETIPRSVDAMAATYRSLLADRRVLVVLDNAATVDQVRPLLPNTATCAVVVTSRNRLAGLVARDGAHRINLDQLPPDEAVSLLRGVIGPTADTDAIHELARRCGYLPLALRIAAEHVVNHPQRPVSDLVAGLADEQRRLDLLAAEDDEATAVRTVFEWSYRALPPPTARVFRLLGLHPGPSFSAPAIAALAGLSDAEVRRHLDKLTGTHMLTELPGNRFQLHDLLRDYSRERADLDEAEDARIAAVPLAATFGFHRLAAQFPFVTTDTLVLRARWQEIVTISEVGLHSAHTEQDSPLILTALSQLADAYFWADRFSESFKVAGQMLTEARDFGECRREAQALHAVAMAQEKLGQATEAVAHYRSALSIYRKIGDLRGEGVMLCMLGNIHRRQQRFNEAKKHIDQAIHIFNRTGNTWSKALALRKIARLHLDLDRPGKAIQAFSRAVALSRAEGDH
ncbi:ATP-binding protein [Saccharothrix syringae]|uniref:Tetratricopeptide repeat protein n=1 Tax=Saccharothrix syringae TaxID=103733 RepID=A0A5Q0H7W0_SACSY|nr:tetratricopeptide repeat protein [Saccharothrix syringae]QFZ22291.1 tetratricopeptide repeat protein [Saccharothrix syringae]